MLFKPLQSDLIIRHNPCHFIPETFRVIHFLSMTKLMHHNIIQNFPGSQGQQTVEIQIPLTASASPPGMLGTYCNLIIGHPDQRRIVLNTLRNQCTSMIPQDLDLLLCQLPLTL